jgi:K+ transporter
MLESLAARRYWSHRVTDIAAQVLWSVTFTAMFAVVQTAIVGCVILSVLVAEAFRKDLSRLIGFSGHQFDPAIQLSWPLVVVIAVLLAISLTQLTLRILPDRTAGSL